MRFFLAQSELISESLRCALSLDPIMERAVRRSRS